MGASVLTILFVLALVIGAVFGLVRGLRRAVVRLLTLVPAVIVSFLAARPAAALLCGGIRIEGKSLGAWLAEGLQGTEMGELFASSSLLQAAAEAMPVFLMTVVMLPAVFLLLQFVTWVIFLIIRRPLAALLFKDSGTDGRIGGLAVGLVTGALCFGVMMSSCFALLDMLPPQKTMEGTLETLVERQMLSSEEAAAVVGAYSVSDCAVVRFYGMVGGTAAGRACLRAAAECTADGETIYLTDECGAVMAALRTALEGGLPEAIPTDGDTSALLALLGDQPFADALCRDLFRSRLFCSVLPGAAASAMREMAVGVNVPSDKAETIAAAVRDTVRTAVAGETAARETAPVVANLVSGAAGILSAAGLPEGEIDPGRLDFSRIAVIVTALQRSGLKGLGSALLDMLIYGEAGENPMVQDLLAALKTHYENGDDLSGIIGSAGAIFALTGGDAAENAAHVRDLISNLDRNSADLILSTLSDDTFAEMGVPEEYATTAHTVFETVITELAGLEDEEKIEAEAEAIAPVLEVLMSDVTQLGTEEIVGLAESTASSEVLHNTVVTLSEEDSLGIEIPGGAISDELAAALREKYEQSESEQERESYLAFAALLGLKLN